MTIERHEFPVTELFRRIEEVLGVEATVLLDREQPTIPDNCPEAWGPADMARLSNILEDHTKDRVGGWLLVVGGRIIAAWPDGLNRWIVRRLEPEEYRSVMPDSEPLARFLQRVISIAVPRFFRSQENLLAELESLG